MRNWDDAARIQVKACAMAFGLILFGILATMFGFGLGWWDCVHESKLGMVIAVVLYLLPCILDLADKERRDRIFCGEGKIPSVQFFLMFTPVMYLIGLLSAHICCKIF